jgi:hypothetical protein
MGILPPQVILIVESAVNRECRQLGVIIEKRQPFHVSIPILQIIRFPSVRTGAAA